MTQRVLLLRAIKFQNQRRLKNLRSTTLLDRFYSNLRFFCFKCILHFPLTLEFISIKFYLNISYKKIRFGYFEVIVKMCLPVSHQQIGMRKRKLCECSRKIKAHRNLSVAHQQTHVCWCLTGITTCA